MQNFKKFHRQIFKQTQDMSILWSYLETQVHCHGNKFRKESTKNDTMILALFCGKMIGQL